MIREDLFAYVIDAVEYSSGLINIKEKNRKREYVDARRIAFYILRKIHGLPIQAIGKEFNKHHASVLYGIRDVEFLIKTDSFFEETYNKTMAKIAIGNFRKEEIMKEIKKLQEEFLTLI